ncbi:MAG: 2Fe-2S iron-sulfur cluster-binding protein [Rhizobiaceae bacterium]|nr:2Fe-2S iron-sulfur cluster-binding protein [Rhizobiaceae bacterium]
MTIATVPRLRNLRFMKLFTSKNRAAHLGPYPLERLARIEEVADYSCAPPFVPVSFSRPQTPASIVNAMAQYQAMMDAIRDGLVKQEKAEIPENLREREKHIKGFAYFSDASMVGICKIPGEAVLNEPVTNPGVDALREELRTSQTTTLASGIDVIMAELKEAMDAPPSSIAHHSHAIVFLYEYYRDPKPDEPGCDWILDCQQQRAAMRGAETAVVMASYLRLLGYEARAHTGSSSDVDLNKLAIGAGLACGENGELLNPFVGKRFGLAAVTTTFEVACDKPLAAMARQSGFNIKGPAWWLGKGFDKSAFNRDPYARRRYVDGALAFEKLKRVDVPTTYIDEPNVARVPKRTDMFARAQFGDMGTKVQEGTKRGNYVRKAPVSMAQRYPLGAFVLLQNKPPVDEVSSSVQDAKRNADNLKAACNFLGVDAVGLSRCPDWTYYSHNALGEEIKPYHDNALSIIIDQGYDTMEGASGDDWIAVAQSMRAYLRFSLLGGVIANQIRSLGYSARVHSVMDGEVLQPPLLLLAGLGEVSRIGEVVLNPLLGPRLKSGAVTTSMPMAHDRPIDFGLQNFCENCNKCARECPSGAITAGPKLMFNGYEIWKSDSQKCATYRITNEGGAMCGRCMKTCPWNLEGLFGEAPFRWAAMNMPWAAKGLAKLDDMAANGSLNAVKKWWWDIEMVEEGAYKPARAPVNERELQTGLDLKYEDQTLAVYPANLAPHPWPFPFPMEREKGIEAYENMVGAREYQLNREKGGEVRHQYNGAEGPSPVLRVQISKVERMSDSVTKYEFSMPDGSPMPKTEAGSHVDIVVAPEFLRQYSLSGDPGDRSRYQIAVLHETDGRGGSQLAQRIFNEGRKVFISRPINHFELVKSAKRHLLMGGGIGITPLIAMGHELHRQGTDFEMHYSIHSRKSAGFLDELAELEWFDNVHIHVSEEGSRADLENILAGYQSRYHLYTCGPERYMNAVLETGERLGWDEAAMHREYFSVPDVPEWVNHSFILRLAKSGREFQVPADKSATDVLAENGVEVLVKCSDGLCGVCKCELVNGEVEHRDFVLSNAQREKSIILCQSRAKDENGIVEVDL